MQIFELTSSHLSFAHEQWKNILKEGSYAIDATCGNGKDTLKLAQLVGDTGGVIALDIQREAIEQTRRLLSVHPVLEKRVRLFHQSHVQFPECAALQPINLIVYNLGYLPGGDKGLTTLTDTTLMSLKQAMQLVAPGGLISITCYPGHLEGKQEQQALVDKLQAFSLNEWDIHFYQKSHSETSPSLLLIYRIHNQSGGPPPNF